VSLGYEHPIVFCRIGKNNVYGGNDMPGLIEEPVLTKKELRKRNKELKKQKKEEARKSKQEKKKEKHISKKPSPKKNPGGGGGGSLPKMA